MQKMIGFFALLLVLAAGCVKTPQTTGAREIPVVGSEENIFTTEMIGGSPWAVPQGMDLVNYPVIERAAKGRRLTAEEVRRMGLRQSMAPAGTVIWNEDPRAKAFWLDTLDKERAVWVNDAGEIVYIADCGNRAMVPGKQQKCPAGVTCPGPHLASASAGGNSWGMPGWLRSLWNFLGNLFLLLLALLLIAALLALALWVLRRILDAVQRDRYQRAPAPAPAPVPVAPRVHRPRHLGRHIAAVPVPAPVAPIAPAVEPDAMFRRYGPYDHVLIDNDGAAGFLVTGIDDGREIHLGSFRGAETENAGERGEYVWVLS